MQETKEIVPGGYYMFESLSSSRSCYFESSEEIRIFKVLLNRYLSDYLHIQKLYVSSEGYQILLRVKSKPVVIKNYQSEIERKGKEIKLIFIKEPWRIISERIRIFHSRYVKCVNKIRGRKGVLVQKRFTRYYFDSISEYMAYENEMETGKEIEGQKEKRYRVEKAWIDRVNWAIFRGVDFVGGLCYKAFPDFVVRKLIISTFSSHIPPP